jgi:hypothetical protein
MQFRRFNSKQQAESRHIQEEEARDDDVCDVKMERGLNHRLATHVIFVDDLFKPDTAIFLNLNAEIGGVNGDSVGE